MKTAVLILFLIPGFAQAVNLKTMSPTAHCLKGNVPETQAELAQRIKETKLLVEKADLAIKHYREMYLSAKGWSLKLVSNETATYAVDDAKLKDQNCSYRSMKSALEAGKESILEDGFLSEDTPDNRMTFGSGQKSNLRLLLHISYSQKKIAEAELADLTTLVGNIEEPVFYSRSANPIQTSSAAGAR